MAPVNALANYRTVPLPSHNSDGDQKYWPDDPIYELKPQDYYYHEVLARLCKDLLPAGTGMLGLLLFSIPIVLCRYHLLWIGRRRPNRGDLGDAEHTAPGKGHTYSLFLFCLVAEGTIKADPVNLLLLAENSCFIGMF